MYRCSLRRVLGEDLTGFPRSGDSGARESDPRAGALQQGGRSSALPFFHLEVMGWKEPVTTALARLPRHTTGPPGLSAPPRMTASRWMCAGMSRAGPCWGLGRVGKTRRYHLSQDETNEGGQHLCLSATDAGGGIEKGSLKVGTPRRDRNPEEDRPSVRVSPH